MASIYDSAELYDRIEGDERAGLYQTHWQRVLRDNQVETLLDVSIGSGNLTLPLAGLGVRLAGSDLSEAMLARCQQKAAAQGVEIELVQSDFCAAAGQFDRRFDCVASTGNSLPHVPNARLAVALAQMDRLVKPGGLLYLDTRNWDKILQQRYRFYLYNPFFDGDVRINLVQVWDYLDTAEPDGEMDFNLLYTFERDGRIFQKEKFCEHYYPVRRAFLLDTLRQLGYERTELLPFPAGAGEAEKPEEADWYCILAHKPG